MKFLKFERLVKTGDARRISTEELHGAIFIGDIDVDTYGKR
jgi:hypothetical protein